MRTPARFLIRPLRPGAPARPAACLALLLAALAGASTAAHRIPLETQAYIKVEGSALSIFVRLPMAVALADARLPHSVRGIFDLETIRPTLTAAAADFVKNLDMMDDGRPLPAPSVAWVVSAPRDDTFATYQAAIVRLAATSLPVDTLVSVTEGFLDLRLDYALASRAPRLSARFNGLRANGQFVPTRATYITAGGDQRLFDVAGAPRRVFFEPSLTDTATMFARLGVARLLGSRELLLFLFCLAIPLRRTPAALAVVGTLLAAVLCAAAFAAMLETSIPTPVPSPPRMPLQLLSQLAASAALVIAALQSMTTPRRGWVQTVCVVFGVALGAGMGSAAREALPFGGSYGVMSLTIYLGVIAGGALVLFPAFRAFVGWFRRLPLPERAMPVILSLVPLHTALHGVQNNGQFVYEAASPRLGGGLLLAAIRHWPPVVAVMMLILLAIAAVVSPGSLGPGRRVREGR